MAIRHTETEKCHVDAKCQAGRTRGLRQEAAPTERKGRAHELVEQLGNKQTKIEHHPQPFP